MKEKVYFLVRHPQTTDDLDGIYRGDDAVLSPEGERQAMEVALRIADIHVECVVTSTIPRAVHLANLIVKHGNVPLYASALFREVRKPTATFHKDRNDYGSKEVMRTIRERFDENYRHSNEEHRELLEARVAKALTYLSELPCDRVAVVTHGKFLRMVWHYLYEDGTLEGFYRKADRRLEHDNVGVTVLALKPNYRTGEMDWTLVTWNDKAVLDVFLTADLRRALESISPA